MKKSINQILCVGSIAYDSIITPFGKANKALGGSATYFSLASSLFAPTTVVGVVGSDFKEFDIYKKRKIDISGVQTAKGKTFHWSGKYHFDMNTRDTLKTELGVFADFKPKLNDKQKQSKYVFLSNIHPKLQIDVLNQIESVGRRTKLVGLDTMNFWIDSAMPDLKKVIKKVNILTINDSEAKELANNQDIITSAGIIFKQMNKKLNPLLIIKLGENGLWLFNQTQKNKKLQMFSLPAYKIKKTIDPTGAGDSFAGALMGYLAKYDDVSTTNIKKACAIASVVASFCVEGFGVSELSKIKLPDINKRLKEYKSLITY